MELVPGPQPQHATLAALYAESGQTRGYSAPGDRPRRRERDRHVQVLLPQLAPGRQPRRSAHVGDNPLRGQDAGSEHHTVANAKGIYNDLLAYFATRQDKLFVVITAPPLAQASTDASRAANARAFNNWLVNDWLDGYPHNNVAVFDFYNVLTSNGGNADTNDLGQATGNHHRWWNGAVQHMPDRGQQLPRPTPAATATPPRPATRRPPASSSNCSTSSTTAGRAAAQPARPSPPA